MKKLITCMVMMAVLVLFTGMALTDTVKFRLVVSRNDATAGGELHVDLEMAIINGNSPRTLNSLTVDVIYGSELSEWPTSNPGTGFAFGSTDGYSRPVDKLTGKYRFTVVGTGVNENCADSGDFGFDITNSFQKLVTFRWKIATTTSVNISIDETNAAAYFENLDNAPCSDAIDWVVENEDLVDVAVPVELSLFAAEATDSGIQLSWRTETETENLGFHVFRSLTEDGEYARINEEIIHGAGSSVDSHDYSYTDSDVLAGTTYYYKLADVDFNGLVTFHGPISAILALPEEYALEQNYPNPFNPNTAIKFSLKEPGHVTLEIYNIQGQLIRTLVTKEYNAGRFSVNWEGTNDRGAKVASGIYLYKIEVNGFRQIKRMVFLK